MIRVIAEIKLIEYCVLRINIQQYEKKIIKKNKNEKPSKINEICVEDKFKKWKY